MIDLIRHLMSVARIGPALRHDLRVALAGGDTAALQAAGRTLVATLVGRGDLVRVLVGDQDEGPARHFALRGHSMLLDLAPIFSEAPADIARDPAGTDRGDRIPGNEFSMHERVLNAMERAQDLNLTRAASDGEAVLLQGVLDMLRPAFDDVDLHVELFDELEGLDPLPDVTHCPQGERPFWTSSRRAGEAVWIHDREELPPRLRAAATDGDADFHGGVAVPLYPPREVLETPDGTAVAEAGLLYAVARVGTERESLIRLARRISRFVTNGWRQAHRMTRLVHVDPLTGVHNRGFFEEQIALEIERAQRRNSTLVLLLGDIDHFKDINDRFGHPAGDRVLRAVARELLRGLRRIDLVCRVGGEEFALVLPNTELDAARDIVTRIQVGIANLRLSDPDAESPLRVTVSFGGAAFPGGGDTPDELYRNADRMLYLSKQRGRNRCHFWNPDGDPVLTLPRYSAPTD